MLMAVTFGLALFTNLAMEVLNGTARLLLLTELSIPLLRVRFFKGKLLIIFAM
jgi:hypothetical protein